MRRPFLYTLIIVWLNLIPHGFCLVVCPDISLLSSSSLDAGLLNQTINISIGSVSTNLSQVEIQLPSGFKFVTNTNATNASSTEFTSSNQYLYWKNATVGGFITPAWFSFYVDLDKSLSGNYTLTVIIKYVTGDSCTLDTIKISINPTAWSSREEFYLTPYFLNFDPYESYSRIFSIAPNQSVEYPFSIYVDNVTVNTSKYGQRDLYLSYSKCFITPNPRYPEGADNLFFVKNVSSQAYTNEFEINRTKINVSLEYAWFCPPGRYEGSILVYNSSSKDENVSLNFVLDVPISKRNQVSSFGNATIYGRIPANSTPHLYYLISSPLHSVGNLTSITIRLEDLEKNLDLFLFDSNDNLISQSIIPANGSDEIVYVFPPPNQTFKIKVFGNFSSGFEDYILRVAFSTLNFTDETQKLISKIDFGDLNLTDKRSKIFFISNVGNLTLNSRLSYEVFREIRKLNLPPGNSTFLLPPRVRKLSVKISWLGDSNYTLKVLDPSGKIAGESVNKHSNSRIFNSLREEFVEIEDNLLDGEWKVEVLNNSLTTSPLNLSVIYWFDESQWLTSNLTNFNLSPHSSIPVQLNLSIPHFAIGGEYKGLIVISSDNGAKIKLPFEFNVTAGTLTVSGKFETIESKVVDNIGFNRIGDNARNITLELRNVGNENLTLSFKTSQFLNHSSGYARFSDITISKTQLKPNEIGYASILIAINTTETNNLPGIYEGWVLFNYSTQNTFSSFNISVKLNLTNLLYVSIPTLKTEDGDEIVENVSKPENITVGIRAWYINETTFELTHQIPNLNEKNFSIVLIESNNTNYKISFEGPDILEADYVVAGYYEVKVTLPSNLLGGLYRVRGRVNHYVNPYLYGESEYHHLIVNNTGLRMELMNSSSIVLYPGNSTILYLKITNFGPSGSDPSIDKVNFIETCPYYSVSPLDFTCEEGTTKDDTSKSFGIKLSGYSSCYVRWKISAASSGDNKYCTGFINADGRWFSPLSFSIDVKVVNTTRVGVAGEEAPSQNFTQTFVDLSFISFPYLILVEQNSSNTTYFKIKNTGNVQVGVTLEIEDINSSWFSILPSGFSISPNEEVSIKLVVKVGEERIDDYHGKMVVSADNKSLSQHFTLRILPGLRVKKEIDEHYHNFTSLLKKFEELLKSLEERKVDTSVVEIKLKLFAQKVSELGDMIARNDYFHAYTLIPQLENMVKSIQATISELEKTKSKKPNFLFYLLICAIIAIISFLIYLFWPVETGYDYKKGKFVWKPEKSFKFLRR